MCIRDRIWKLTRGHVHTTEISNASRTLVFNIDACSWDDEILARFGIPRETLPEVTPTTGVLYQDMFLTNGSTIEKNFGYRTFIEPDLMVIVKDTDIMKAKTEIQVLQHLISVHPYIELPALRFVKGEVITGHHVVALNMLATKMVMGPGIEIQATEIFLQKITLIYINWFCLLYTSPSPRD